MLSRIAVLVCLLSACGMPPMARPGTLLAPGEFTLGPYIGGTFGGATNSGERSALDRYFSHVANVGFSARVGVSDDCELGGDLAFLRQGVDVRCALLDIAHGDSLTLAPVAGVAYLPFRGFEWRGGLDLAVDADAVHPIAHLGLSRASRLLYRPTDRTTWNEGQNFWVQPETRLEMTFGVGIPLKGNSALMFAINPFWRLHELGVAPAGASFSIGAAL